MVKFKLKNVSPIGVAQIQENGDLVQQCILETLIEGIVLQDKNITDITSFTVPNSEMVGKPQPITSAWDYIKNILAPEWVDINYATI